MLYLDHNATAPLCNAARHAWLDAHEKFIGNASSMHRWGQRAERALDEARHSVAAVLGCSESELVWTSGATESANAVLASLAKNSDGCLLVSPVEHPCVLEPAKRWFCSRMKVLGCDSAGRIDLEEIRKTLASGPVAAVVVMAANNETGVIQPWQRLADLCSEQGVPFVCDATQWVGKRDSRGLGQCTYAFGSTHKVGGPVGIGFLKLPGSANRTPWNPLITGGPQEEGRRAGTQNVAAALAMAATLQDRRAWLLTEDKKTQLQKTTERHLKERITGLQIVAEDAERLWNTTSVLLPPLPDCRRRWVVRLDAAGIAASSGSACSSGSASPSHVLGAMGLEHCADRVIRLSSGWETSEADWQQAVATIQSVVERG
jgi:cysteine desulfurase